MSMYLLVPDNLVNVRESFSYFHNSGLMQWLGRTLEKNKDIYAKACQCITSSQDGECFVCHTL